MMTRRSEVDVPASTATARTTPTEKIRTPDWHGRYTALRFGIICRTTPPTLAG
jgi:hypothetical protein